MVWSKYNFLFETEKNGFFLYNSYTNNFMELSKENFEILKLCKEGNVDIIDEEIRKCLIDECILVECDDDIYNKIRLQRSLVRFNDSYLALTIAPTLACNFRCIYCYETGIENISSMSEEDIPKIVSFVKNYPLIKFLRVTWYGGEPLLRFPFIESLTSELKAIVPNYEASMITNGYLLDEEVASKLKSLCIKQLQVTIDGLRATHNARRPHVIYNDSFEKIISNLENLFSVYPEIKISLRVNVDKTNCDEYHDLYDFLVNKFKGYELRIHPGYVTDDYSVCKYSSCMQKDDKVTFLLKQHEKYNIPMGFYPRSEFGECGARHINSFVIGPSGELYKCWNDIGIKEKSVGNIENYSLSNSLMVKYLMEADPLSSNECKECFYFPICNGGCPYTRIYRSGDTKSVCQLMKEHLQEFLMEHYKIKNKFPK